VRSAAATLPPARGQTPRTTFPTGHAAAWAKLASRTLQSGSTSKDGRTGKGNPYLRAAAT
jgi:transposase